MHILNLVLLALTAFLGRAWSHLILTYPGTRGNNLLSSGRTPDNQVPMDGLGVHYNNQTNELEYPYGMEWIYPCECFIAAPPATPGFVLNHQPSLACVLI